MTVDFWTGLAAGIGLAGIIIAATAHLWRRVPEEPAEWRADYYEPPRAVTRVHTNERIIEL
jgi:hypothetical protein